MITAGREVGREAGCEGGTKLGSAQRSGVVALLCSVMISIYLFAFISSDYSQVINPSLSFVAIIFRQN